MRLTCPTRRVWQRAQPASRRQRATPRRVRYNAPTMSGSDRVSRASGLERYRRATDLPLNVLALAIIPLLVIPLTTHISPAVGGAFLAADLLIWAVFTFDLLLRTYLSDNRVGYLKAHWFDVPIIALPFLRPLRVVRSEEALRLLQLSRAEHGARFMATAKERLRKHRLAQVLAIAVVLLVGAAVLGVAWFWFVSWRGGWWW